MSQDLTPLNNGIGEVKTTLNVDRPRVISYKAQFLRNLEPQLTEWRPEGKPIYNRLPSVSENYRIDFFEDKGKGYVYIPYGEGIFGPRSMQVVASENDESIVIKPGNVVWEYGTSPVNATIVNCELVGLQSTRYLIGYQLYYDDAPFDAQYAVKDYSLTGYPLEITSSTDAVVGWRYPAVNAFLSSSQLLWRASDEEFPPYAQPNGAWVAWESEKPLSCYDITFRCFPNSVASGTASLYFYEGNDWVLTSETSASFDENSFFFKFELDSPTFQKKFRVEWSSSSVAINSVTVSGTLTITSRPATLTTFSSLVAYPENMVPDTFTNGDGEEVPVSICELAYVDVDETFRITNIDDVRTIVHREYKPVTEWLSRPEDEDLIDMYEQVSRYSELWMSPQNAMKHEYAKLNDKFVQLLNPENS